MVRVYKRKTNRGQHGSMEKAIALKDRGLSIRDAAMQAGVSHVTLSRRLKRKDAGGYKQPRSVFDKATEEELQDYLITCSRMSHGLTPIEVRKLAYDYATENGMENVPDSWKNRKEAGKDWLNGFLKRSGNLSIRKPEATSLGRATSFNKHNVQAFFKNLSYVLSTNKIQPGRIWDMDETKTTTVYKPPKVVGDKKIKQLGQVTSAERGVLITGVCCINSAGSYIPPAFIWPRKTDRNTEAYMRGTPTSSLGLFHDSGWMTSDNFKNWMSHFIKHAKPTPQDPVVLLLDNHQSHLKCRAINMAKDNGVVMLTFPPHTTHRLQPLDVSVFGPFQTYYNAACNDWQLSNPGKTICLYDIGELAGKAFLRAMTPENIINGFCKTGISPFDENVFSEADFLPSSVTDRDIGPTQDINVDIGYITKNAINSEDELEYCKSTKILQDERQPSTSTVQRFPKPRSSPSDLRPFPKAPSRKRTKASKRRKSVILTYTPVKTQLEQKAKNNTNQAKLKPRSLKKIPSDSSESDDDPVPLNSDSDGCTEDIEGILAEDYVDQPLDLKEGAYVITQYTTKKRKLLYVAIVEKIEEDDISVKFLKKTGQSDFILPKTPETDTLVADDIVTVLPHPQLISGTARCSSKRRFSIDLTHITG